MRNRIAVLIPCFNNWPGLKQSLHSLAAQSVDADVLIVDDGSAVAISESACKQEHPRVRVIRQSPNAGIITALNSGIEVLLAERYEYIARLDAGDRCIPERLEVQAKFLDENPDVMLVGSDTAFEDANNGDIVHVQRGPYASDVIRRGMHLNSCFSHPSIMLRASVLESVGNYSREDLCAEDYGLFFRITDRFAAANIAKVLTVSELNVNGISLSRRREQLRSRLRIQVRHFRAGMFESYFGLLKTIALVITPRSVTLRLKRKLHHRAGRGEVI